MVTDLPHRSLLSGRAPRLFRRRIRENAERALDECSEAAPEQCSAPKNSAILRVSAVIFPDQPLSDLLLFFGKIRRNRRKTGTANLPIPTETPPSLDQAFFRKAYCSSSARILSIASIHSHGQRFR